MEKLTNSLVSLLLCAVDHTYLGEEELRDKFQSIKNGIILQLNQKYQDKIDKSVKESGNCIVLTQLPPLALRIFYTVKFEKCEESGIKRRFVTIRDFEFEKCLL